MGARVSEMGDDRFLMQYRIVSEKLQKIAAEGEGLIVSFDYREGHRAPVPAKIRAQIEALEGRSLT